MKIELILACLICFEAILLVSSSSDAIHSRLLDSQTGSFLWETRVPIEETLPINQVSRSPCSVAALSGGSGDVIVLAANTVFRLDRQTGSISWKHSNSPGR